MEYLTGGGMRQETLPAALAQEGEIMVRALVDDLLALSLKVELVVLRDDRLEPLRPNPRMQAVMVGVNASFYPIWEEGISRCDAVWPIAPETGGLLERFCMEVEQAGKTLLTCPSAAVRLAASKLKTIRRLAEHALPVVETAALAFGDAPSHYPLVVKPDDGVGCENSRIICHAEQLKAYAGQPGWIVQPLLEGEPLSLSVLFAQGQARLLSCNRQRVEQTDDGFAFRGITVNAIRDVDSRWQRLAGGVALAIPELWGYVGIDLILTTQGPLILEINPRLTTAYAGLHLATGENPAGGVLHLCQTGQLPPITKRPTGKPVTIDLRKTGDD